METKDVLTVNISEETASKIESDIRDVFFKMELLSSQSSVDIALLVAKAIKCKLHTLRGYENTAKGQTAYLKETFGIGDTQRKDYLAVAMNFATCDSENNFTLVDTRLRDFGVTKLTEINRLPQFEAVDRSNGSEVMKALENLGITSKTTVADLRKLKGIEDKSGKKETKEKNVSRETSETVSEDKVTTELKKANDEKTVKLDSIRDLLADLTIKCNDKSMKDKEFRLVCQATLQKIENMYK